MDNLRSHILAITQAAEIEESRVERLVKFTADRQTREPSTVCKVMTVGITAFGALIIGGGAIGFLTVTLDITHQPALFLIVAFSFFPPAFLSIAASRKIVGRTLLIIGLIAAGAPASFDFDESVWELFLFPVWLAIAVLVGVIGSVLFRDSLPICHHCGAPVMPWTETHIYTPDFRFHGDCLEIFRDADVVAENH